MDNYITAIYYQRVSMPLHPLVSEVADNKGGVKATHTRIIVDQPQMVENKGGVKARIPTNTHQ